MYIQKYVYTENKINSTVYCSLFTHLTGQQLAAADVCCFSKRSKMFSSSIVRDISSPKMKEIQQGCFSCLRCARLRWVTSPCFSFISSIFFCINSSSWMWSGFCSALGWQWGL